MAVLKWSLIKETADPLRRANKAKNPLPMYKRPYRHSTVDGFTLSWKKTVRSMSQHKRTSPKRNISFVLPNQ